MRTSADNLNIYYYSGSIVTCVNRITIFVFTVFTVFPYYPIYYFGLYTDVALCFVLKHIKTCYLSLSSSAVTSVVVDTWFARIETHRISIISTGAKRIVSFRAKR